MNDTAVLYCTAWPRTASTAPQIRISSVALVQNTGGALSETACIAENGARQIKSKFFEEKKNWRGAGKGMRGREMIRRMRQLVSGQSESSLHGTPPISLADAHQMDHGPSSTGTHCILLAQGPDESCLAIVT